MRRFSASWALDFSSFGISYSQDALAAQIGRNSYLIEENFVQQAHRLGLVEFAYFLF